MSGEKLYILALLLAFAAGQSCPIYTCAQRTDYCIYYPPGTNTVQVSNCTTPGTYCPMPPSGANVTCTTRTNNTLPKYPGEKCKSSTECLSNNCYKGYCKGAQPGEYCLISSTYLRNGACDPGLYCDLTQVPAICVPLKEDYEPCTSDNQCQYGTGCYMCDTCTTGICLEYGKLDSGTELYGGNCQNSYSKYCEDGQCFKFSNGTAICIDDVENRNSLNSMCTTNIACQSTFSVEAQRYITGTCQCTWNSVGTKYCSTFPGEGYFEKFLEFFDDWDDSENAEKCNIDIAYTDKCIKSHGSTKDLTKYYLYTYMYMYENYLAGAPSCIASVMKSVLNIPALSETMIAYEVDSFGFYLALSGIVLAF